VERAARLARLAPGLTDDAKLAVTEACANVVAHAYDATTPPDQRVMLLRTEVSDEGLLVAVSDTGAGIGRRAGTAGAGLGLPLVRTLASEVDVRSDAGGTRIELRFRHDV
jgi:serine/threonine-protein kinase RsbW